MDQQADYQTCVACVSSSIALKEDVVNRATVFSATHIVKLKYLLNQKRVFIYQRILIQLKKINYYQILKNSLNIKKYLEVTYLDMKKYLIQSK